MKKAIIMLAAMVLLAAPAMADYSGGRVYYDRLTGYYAGNGGEFTIRSDGPPGLLLSNAAYDAKARDKGYAGSFQTFCVETGEYVAQPMDIMVSETFVNEATGAITGPGSHAILGSKLKGDNLDPRTAYLYTQFAKGVLSSYNYGGGRSTSAGELQEAIWKIEEEIGSANGQAATWIAEAETAIANSTWSGIGDVRILNMSTLSSGLAQDQLYLVPAPAAIGLGLIGLGLVGWVKRRLA